MQYDMQKKELFIKVRIRKLCGQVFTQYKYRLRNKATNKNILCQNMKTAGILKGVKP